METRIPRITVNVRAYDDASLSDSGLMAQDCGASGNCSGYSPEQAMSSANNSATADRTTEVMTCAD
jgi:hypothetical protein